MKQRTAKIFLTSHVAVSVGWFGAVAVFLALAISGIASKNVNAARAAYVAMEISAWFIILPFCTASLATGIVQAAITKWGLLNHYWIIVKLIFTLGCTILLMLHLKPIGQLAHIANSSAVAITQPGLQMQMIADSGAALVVLLSIITISVYKPWGRTRFALRDKNNAELIKKANAEGQSFKKYFLIGIVVLIIIIVIKHLTGDGMHGH